MSAAPLRICFVAYRGNMRCGGQGIYLWFLARELARLGHVVDVLVGPPFPAPMPFARSVSELPNDCFWGKWFSHDRARMLPRPNALRIFEPLRYYELAASWIGFFPEPFAFTLRAFREIVRRVRAGHRYDVVHDVQCLGWGLLGVRALGLPVVTTVHHPLSVDRRASFARDRTLLDAVGTAEFHPVGMQGFVARRLDRVLTSSHASSRALVRDYRVPSGRIHMVANGIDTELFCPDPAVSRASSELLCVARASDPTKGVETLLAALTHLPSEVRLTLVDDDSPSNPARSRARKLGIADRVRIAGPMPVEALRHLYRRSTLVVAPSHYEGFGLPAVEAMACGTPVVASAAGALREVVGESQGGVLVPPADAQALAKAVSILLEQPHARQRLGRRGRVHVEAAYAWPRIAARTVEVYGEAREERSRGRGRPARITTSATDGRRRARASST